MSSIEDRYYKLNRFWLKILGIWPYQNSKWAYVQTIIIRSLYLSGIFVQLTVFITHECKLDELIEVFSFVFPAIFILLMYNIYYYNSNTFKEFFENIYHDWKIFNTKAEHAIIDSYCRSTKFFTRLFLTCAYIGIFMTIMTHAIPITLDIILPLNETRKQNIHVMVEYFVDPSKYYILIILHLSILICCQAITVTATGVTILSFSFHICALFKLSNYHMEAVMDQNLLQIYSPKREHVIYEKIVFAIAIHRKALQFSTDLVASLEKWFFFITIIGVISLSVNLFRMFRAITHYTTPIDVFIPVAFVLGHLCYMFFGNHVGQQITDHNTDIFDTIYKLPWYTTTLNTQKLLLFLLLKGSNTFYISLAGILKISYECFTTLATSSISYFTVIYSFQ